MASFTTQIQNLEQLGPLTQLNVTIPAIFEQEVRKEQRQEITPIPVQAMVDTGAQSSVIKKEIVEKLNLHPVGTIKISTPSSKDVGCYQYLLRLVFQTNVIIDTVVTAAPLEGQHIQFLIGRDVLKQGVLIYTGYINQFTLCF